MQYSSVELQPALPRGLAAAPQGEETNDGSSDEDGNQGDDRRGHERAGAGLRHRAAAGLPWQGRRADGGLDTDGRPHKPVEQG